LDEWSEARRQKSLFYNRLFLEAGLDQKITLPFVAPGNQHIFHQYVIRIPKHRDSLLKYLFENGIGSKVYYPVPLHLQKCFDYLGHKNGDFPEAERASLETLALPCFPELTEEQQLYVVEVLGKFPFGD